MTCTDKSMVVLCGEEVIVDANNTPQTPIYQPFSFCSMGKNFYYDGVGLTVTGTGVNIPDGEYTTVAVQDNCIVGFGVAPLPQYTPPPCVEAPTGGCGDGGSGGATIDPSTDNLTTDGISGVKTKLYTANTATVTLSGYGTASSPLMATATGGGTGGGGTVIAGEGIRIDMYASGQAIGLREVGIKPATYNGFSVNKFGQILAYNAPSGGTTLNAVEGVGDVKVTTSPNGVAVVSLPVSGVGSDFYTVGAYSVRYSASGLTSEMVRMVDIAPFVMKVPDFEVSPPSYRRVSIDDYGTVIGSVVGDPIGNSMLQQNLPRSYELVLDLASPLLLTAVDGYPASIQTSRVILTIASTGLIVGLRPSSQPFGDAV